MAYVNIQRRFIQFKIIYYGPEHSGKTANLEYLSTLTADRGEILTLEAEGDEEVFFEHMPLSLGTLRGIDTVFKLYTVPGQASFNKTRQAVLRDADGIIFVVDSQAEALKNNIESLQNLLDNLTLLGVKLTDLPMVIQYNKCDLPNSLPIEKLQESLNISGRPWFEASVVDGQNVKESLNKCIQLVYQLAVSRYSLIPSAPSEAKSEEIEEQALEQPAGEEQVEEQFDDQLEEQFDDETEERFDDQALEQPVSEKLAEEQIEEVQAPEQPKLEEVSLDLPEDEELALNLSFKEDPAFDQPGKSIPLGDLARGVAAHIDRTVSPPAMGKPIPRPNLKKMTRAASQNKHIDFSTMIENLEETLLKKLKELDARVQSIAERQEESEKAFCDVSDIRESLESINDKFKGFGSSILSLQKAFELMARTQATKVLPPTPKTRR